MRNKGTKLVAPAMGWRRFRTLIGLILLALAGCFGPPTMHYDIQEYNKQVVSSEQEMLLYNIGRLNRRLPPHFMMLSTVSQTRMFSGSASFQWSQMWNSLFSGIPNKNLGSLAKGSNTWEAGPFTAGAMENPTIVFVPIQGQDFATRFESTLTDKFSLFSEDLWKSGSREQLADLFEFFAEDLELLHGDGDICRQGVYSNRFSDPLDLGDPTARYYVEKFSKCVDELITKPLTLDYEQIDGDHPVPTSTTEGPKATDVVSALTNGYKWAKSGSDYRLTNPWRMPGWFDYTPIFESPPVSTKNGSSLPAFWVQNQPPDWLYQEYTLPKGYSWKVVPVNKNFSKSDNLYALLPDGYELDRDDNGELKRDKNGNRVLVPIDSVPLKYELTRTSTGELKRDNSGRPILVQVKDKPSKYRRFSYANAVVRAQWPFPYDMVYIERRNNVVDDTTAEFFCVDDPQPYDTDQTGLICGYFKIGNLLQIMQRLASTACNSTKPEKFNNPTDPKWFNKCDPSIFGIGPDVPSWADISAPFTDTDGTKQYVWVPAHDPAKEADLAAKDWTHKNLADRDRTAFFTLYKLYQMSLVDTTKLVTGAPPVTISK